MYTNHADIRQKITTTLSDNELDVFAKSVSDHIDSFVGYILASDKLVASYYFDGTGTEYAFLGQPLHSYSNLVRIGDLSNETLDQSSFVSYPLNESHTAYFGLRRGVFKGGIANYYVQNAQIGRYSLANLPQEIKNLATSLCVKMVEAGGVSLSNASNGVSGLKTSETIGSYSVSYANNQSATSETIFNTIIGAKEILSKYKIAKIA